MGPTATDLRTIPLFRGFDDAELAALSGLFVRASAETGAKLFDVGENAQTLYLLTAGTVTLERPGDDTFRLSPPALIGELGALTGLPRSTRATVDEGATVWALSAQTLQGHFNENQELAIRFLANLLDVVADKVHRDQTRMADMRQNLIGTQKELKRLRELVLDAPETPVSAPVHDSLDKLITHNRRVNYRVEPPAALAATMRLETSTVGVVDLSRTHVTVRDLAADAGTWISGVLSVAGTEIPISGRVQRVEDDRATIELDLLIDEFAAALEGYLTRVQLLDVLV